MGVEIERKYLVQGDTWRGLVDGIRYRQGYLTADKQRTVRVRTAGECGWLTVKGVSVGISRAEYEYEIPVADADRMLDTLCLRPLIEKIRYRIVCSEQVWEVDEFLGDNLGLLVAEIELCDAQQQIDLPDWVGMEVSGDARYFNSNLISHPFNTW